MKQWSTVIMAFFFVMTASAVCAQDKGLHLGEVDKSMRKTEIEAKKTDQQLGKEVEKAQNEAPGKFNTFKAKMRQSKDEVMNEAEKSKVRTEKKIDENR